MFIVDLSKFDFCTSLISADVLSLSSFEGVVARSSVSSLRDANHGDCSVNNHQTSSTSHAHKPGVLSRNSAYNSVGEVSKTLNIQVSNLDDVDSQSKRDGSSNEANQPVFLNEISSSMEKSPGKEVGMLDNCGILPSYCLPFLPSTVPSVEKRRSLSSSPPSLRKKGTLKLSFKWKEGNADGTLREYRNYQLFYTLFHLDGNMETIGKYIFVLVGYGLDHKVQFFIFCPSAVYYFISNLILLNSLFPVPNPFL